MDKKLEGILNDEKLTKEEKESKAEELFTQFKIMEDFHKSNVDVAILFGVKNGMGIDMVKVYVDILSEKGQFKAIEQIELLSRIPEYQKNNKNKKG